MNTRKEEFVFLGIITLAIPAFLAAPAPTIVVGSIGTAGYLIYKATPWLRAHFNALTFWLADFSDAQARRRHRREKQRLGYNVVEPGELKRLVLGMIGVVPRRRLAHLFFLIPAAVLVVAGLVWFVINWLREPRE